MDRARYKYFQRESENLASKMLSVEPGQIRKGQPNLDRTSEMSGSQRGRSMSHRTLPIISDSCVSKNRKVITLMRLFDIVTRLKQAKKEEACIKREPE